MIAGFFRWFSCILLTKFVLLPTRVVRSESLLSYTRILGENFFLDSVSTLVYIFMGNSVELKRLTGTLTKLPKLYFSVSG